MVRNVAIYPALAANRTKRRRLAQVRQARADRAVAAKRAAVKKAASNLHHELGRLSDEAWALLSWPPELRERFMAQLRAVSERGVEALRNEPR